jgi:hypothetical protein
LRTDTCEYRSASAGREFSMQNIQQAKKETRTAIQIRQK